MYANSGILLFVVCLLIIACLGVVYRRYKLIRFTKTPAICGNCGHTYSTGDRCTECGYLISVAGIHTFRSLSKQQRGCARAVCASVLCSLLSGYFAYVIIVLFCSIYGSGVHTIQYGFTDRSHSNTKAYGIVVHVRQLVRPSGESTRSEWLIAVKSGGAISVADTVRPKTKGLAHCIVQLPSGRSTIKDTAGFTTHVGEGFDTQSARMLVTNAKLAFDNHVQNALANAIAQTVVGASEADQWTMRVVDSRQNVASFGSTGVAQSYELSFPFIVCGLWGEDGIVCVSGAICILILSYLCVIIVHIESRLRMLVSKTRQ